MKRLEQHLERLHSRDEAERIYAAEDIGYLDHRGGVASLLGHLRGETSTAVRDAIFLALVRIDSDAAIEGCIGLLSSGDPQIRNRAVDALRRKGSRTIPFLAAVMKAGGGHIRKLVLDVLSGIAAGDAGEIYESALSDPEPNVVITAVENLGVARAVAFRSRVENLLRTASHPMLIAACMEALVGLGDRSSPEAIRARFPDWSAMPDFLLASCLRVVAAWGSDREFPEVASLLPLRSSHLRPAILDALAEIYPRCVRPPCESGAYDENLVPELRDVVGDGDPPLCRYQAARLLGFWASRDDVRAWLISCLSSTECLVRLGTVEALREANRPELEAVFASRVAVETDAEVLRALRCKP